jgi:hypothetical protein
VVERREQLRFALASRKLVSIGRDGARQQFGRYVAVEPRIARD